MKIFTRRLLRITLPSQVMCAVGVTMSAFEITTWYIVLLAVCLNVVLAYSAIVLAQLEMGQ